MGEEAKKLAQFMSEQSHNLNLLREEIRRLMQIVESKESLIPRFVESSPAIRTYGKMIENQFDPRRGGRIDDVYIMGYFDQVLLDRLLPAARFVRIVCPKSGLGQKRNKDALTRMSKAGAKVRIHDMVHARIFCIPDRQFIIIGSGDLQTNCFGGSRFDAGVWANHPDLIKAAIDFFNRVWDESDPLPETNP